MTDWKNKLLNKKTFWIFLGAISIAFRAALPTEVIEQYYSRGLFLLIRKAFAILTGWMPFAGVYLLFFIVLFLLIFRLVKLVKSKDSALKKLVNTAFSFLAFAGGVVFFFLFLWGYNYGRIPLEEQLRLEPKALTANDLKEEVAFATQQMIRYRSLLTGVGDSVVSATFQPNNIEAEMRKLVEGHFQKFGYPTTAKVRGRMLYPDGLLLRISTAGVYIPFTGEGHIDPGLHHLQVPFVMAHELSHGYGIGGEGTCNFLAYLACTESDNAYLKYIGYLYYWRYVAPDYRAYRPEEYKQIWENLPAGIKADLRAISAQMAKYPDIFPAIRDAAYNTYLKAQGIDDGIKNYDRVTMLVRAWRLNGN